MLRPPPSRRVLLNQNPQFNAKDNEGKTALIHAAENGHRHVCEALVNSKCIDINMQDAKRWTALMWAAHCGHTDVVQFLVGASADSAVHDAGGRTALQLADPGVRNASVLAILEGERAQRVREVTLEAARKGFANVISKAVAELLRHDALEDMSLALLAASSSGHEGIVEQLLSSRANINFALKPKSQASDGEATGTPREGQQSGSALLLAAANGHNAVVNLLIGRLADINLLAEDGSTLAPDHGISPLWVAAKNGCVDVVKACITAHADLEVCNWDGTTPLIIATKEGHAEVVRGLLEVGANVFAKDMFGRTAGDIALLAVGQQGNADAVASALECANLLLPAKTPPPLTQTLELLPRVVSPPARSGEGGPSLTSLERVFGSVCSNILSAGSQRRSDQVVLPPSPAPSH